MIIYIVNKCEKMEKRLTSLKHVQNVVVSKNKLLLPNISNYHPFSTKM